MTFGIETYRGEALAWEADDLGHTNMRFYFQRARQARAALFVALGLPSIYKSGALATVIPKDQLIKYHREVRPGQGMYARSAILEISDTRMQVLHMIYCVRLGGDVVSATVIETLHHISRRTGAEFNWPSRVRDAASKLMTDMNVDAAPRNIDLSKPIVRPGVARADEIDLQAIGRGNFMTHECDAFGSVRVHDLIGRVSDSVQHLVNAWPGIDFEHGDISGALLEARVVHYAQPVAGDHYVIRSGLRGSNRYTREIGHWLLDPVSGKAWAGMIGVACKFDLKERRLMKVDDAENELIQAHINPGLID